MPVVDCDENLNPLVTRNQVRRCPEYIFKDHDQRVNVSLPITMADQNNHTLVQGFLTIDEILTISMIPDLNFNQSLVDFANATWTDIGNLGAGPPTRWQRPLNFKRERDIRDYFLTVAGGLLRRPESLIPGSVVLGEREVEGNNANVSVDVTARMPHQHYSMTVEYDLLEECPECNHTEIDTFFDRCPAHGCVQHKLSRAPFQIIDGQHRVLGMKRLAGEEKVPVVFLLFDKHEVREDVDGQSLVMKPTIRGTEAPVQAEIFEKMNNEGANLDSLHSLWIKRMLDPANMRLGEADAFDLLCNLGRNVGAGSNKWRGKVQFQPKPSSQPFINSKRGVEMGANTGAIRQILPNLSAFAADAAVGSPTHQQQLINFIRGAIDDVAAGPIVASPKEMFTGGGVRPFAGGRLFEVIIRNYDLIAQWAKRLDGALNHTAFVNAWNLQSDSFDVGNGPTWSKYRSTGELPWQYFEMYWKLMWDQPLIADPASACGFSLPKTAPDWETDLGVATACTDWGEYAGLAPDPITLLDPGTMHVSGGSTVSSKNPGGPAMVTTVLASFDMEWNAPVNILNSVKPLVQVRFPEAGGGWSSWDEIDSEAWSGLGTINASLDLSDYVAQGQLAVGDQFQIQIEYENLRGSRVCQLQYELM